MQSVDRFTYPRLLTIAGSDSCGGAGIQADLKTFSALGCYGMTAITALTAQNTVGVQSIVPTPAAMLRTQIDSILSDVGCDAAKIGMVPDAPGIRALAQALHTHAIPFVVLDPVITATTGSTLMEHSAAAVLLQELAPLSTLITPNLPEARLLAEQNIESVDDMLEAAIEAGADMVFPEAITELEMYKLFASRVKAPILANITEFGATPLYTTEQLAGADVSLVLYPLSAFRAMNKAAENVYTAIRRDGTQQNVIDTMQTRMELYDRIDYHTFEQKLDALFAAQKK